MSCLLTTGSTIRGSLSKSRARGTLNGRDHDVSNGVDTAGFVVQGDCPAGSVWCLHARRAAGSCRSVWSDRHPVKVEAAGSNPVRTALVPSMEAANHGRVAQLAERPPEKRKVRGSTPRPTTKSSDTHSADAKWPPQLFVGAKSLGFAWGSRLLCRVLQQ